MEENAIVTTENEVIEGETTVTTNENSGGSTALGVVIGALGTLATITIVNKVKKAWRKHKAKKEVIEAECEIVETDEEEYVEDSDED